MSEMFRNVSDYSEEIRSDIEKLIEIYEKVPAEKRGIFLITLRAFIEGLTIGTHADE